MLLLQFKSFDIVGGIYTAVYTAKQRIVINYPVRQMNNTQIRSYTADLRINVTSIRG
jgi:hypothetical protein